MCEGVGKKAGMVAHSCNPGTQEDFLSLNPVWYWASGLPRLKIQKPKSHLVSVTGKSFPSVQTGGDRRGQEGTGDGCLRPLKAKPRSGAPWPLLSSY